MIDLYMVTTMVSFCRNVLASLYVTVPSNEARYQITESKVYNHVLLNMQGPLSNLYCCSHK